MAKKELKTCSNCGHKFERLNKYVVDVGEDFCAEFRFACPKCKLICELDKIISDDKKD